MEPTAVRHTSLFTDYDIFLFKSGRHYRIYDKLGSHLTEVDGVQGTYFAVWAPNARAVSVIGNFNQWRGGSHPLSARWDQSGIWEGFIPNIGKGELYKFEIETYFGQKLNRSDLYARLWETPPATSSVVWEDDYQWEDEDYMQQRKKDGKKKLSKPYAVYEVHLGTWKKPGHGPISLNYRELATELTEYVVEMGYTHIEFLPVMEHPYFPSWGYQLTGYFAPSSRFGKPEDFKYLVDKLHQAGIGVILDWVPSHFPLDAHGLANYDGTGLYEHEDPRQGFHPDWKSAIFNYGRNEVRNFLISNALYWLDEYHIDGLRVDAVASMLYLDYSREEGEWIPNKYGGNENLEAVSFLKEFNDTVHKEFPDVVTIAEESTAYAGVSKPVEEGGLGFDQKWMMGWMHDTLEYMKMEPIYRSHHQGQISFSMIYAYSERFMLPLSHDEVVHGKASLIYKMPGDEWQKFANLRLLYGYMYMHPGTKLLFMGCEFAQTTEWNIERGLEWELTQHPTHQGMSDWVKTLNKYYTDKPALYRKQFDPEGFEWISHDDNQNSVLAFLRKGNLRDKAQLVICNFTPVVREDYRIGAPKGKYKLMLNSDDAAYQGSGVAPAKTLTAKKVKEPLHGKDYAISLTLPPLAVVVFEKG